MLITPRKFFFLLVVLTTVGLAGCDFSSQNADWKPYGTYSIEGPITAGGAAIDTPISVPPAMDAYFYVEAFTTKKQYQWTVKPEQPSEVTRSGQMFKITFQDPGTYTITVEASGHKGETTVSVVSSR